MDNSQMDANGPTPSPSQEYGNNNGGMMMQPTLQTTQGRQLLPNYTSYHNRLPEFTPSPASQEAVDPALQQPQHPNPGQTNPTGYPQCVTASTNMLTRHWNVPAKNRPGRKRLDDPRGERRREQNRKAQRDFRARKADKVQELEQLLLEEREEHSQYLSGLQQELGRLQQQCSFYQQGFQSERSRAMCFYQQLSERQPQPLPQQQHQHQHQSQHRLSGDSQSSFNTSPTDSRALTVFSSSEVSPTDSQGTFYSSQTSPTDSSAGGPSPSNGGGKGPGQPPAVEAHLRGLPDPAHNPRQSTSLETLEIPFNAPPQRPTENGNGGNLPEENERCGFCTDDSNCVCFTPTEVGAAQSLLEFGNRNGSSSGGPGAGAIEKEHQGGPPAQWQQ
ncbi:MAG: hypothetical protein M1831_002393 [Alyxoria varia]|nr:MAG: hypothetical protein M1831_002393 [Alyxoria varia]